jgi:peptidoglycan/LPS O-acetylase OafA/YrhL
VVVAELDRRSSGARWPGPLDPARGRPQRLLGHAPALDGLRGTAVALIVVFHFAGHYVLHGATASLDVFFALSGFLITGLILDERRQTGRVSLASFYVRRACRLLPALLAMLAVWTVLLLLFHDQGWMGSTPAGDGSAQPVAVKPALGSVAVALVYLANWDVVQGGSAAPLQHLWSLAVEEQFYIVWPTVLLLLLRLRLGARYALVAAGIGGSVLLCALLWIGGAGSSRLYFGTDTRAASLLMGALAAMVWHRRRARGREVGHAAAVRAWLGVGMVAVIIAELQEGPIKYVVVPALVALGVTQVMPYVIDRPDTPLARLLSVRWLVWLGQRSYALYLWHYLWATWTHGLPPATGIPLGVAGALLCTVLSWRVVEKPALAWGRRRQQWSPRVPSRVPQAVPERAAA